MNEADEHRFRAFVQARTPALMRVAYLLAGTQHDAEDLLQTALTRTALRFSRIRHDDPEAYVRRILYREQVSRWRRRSRRPEAPTHPLPETAVIEPGTGVELRLAVRQALAQLTPRQRAVLVLRYFEDLPEADVARLLGCSLGTVRSQTHRAITKFRRLAPDLAGARAEEVR